MKTANRILAALIVAAADQPSGKHVLFGGEENTGSLGVVRFGDTTVCD